MTPACARQRGPGRPRNASADHAILAAAAELVSGCGYERTTVEAIAAHAGVSKPSIYRRWPGGKAELVAAAVSEMRDEVTLEIDTGSLRGDLVALVEMMIGGMQSYAHLAAGLTQRLRESPELARVFREQVVLPDRERFLTILQRAVGRGELPELPDVAPLVADLAPALVHFRALVSGDGLGPSLCELVVDRVILPALRTTRPLPEPAR